ncbi:NAD-dependent epimerase/dehydratase family protein [Actinoplanes aureus]|uniref:NAD(P)-dependent oxidoreductase n=1 Tax=Actinoplanes aureus TaxID=2792083 RepID=A0A931CEL8_9ACTN|nr:NAD(P)-dependent oxidoreductase [Actinoplanes aureus]MBG0568475.1 NAD(P)-dependent oxidoreductase [Actinoplanes aureus]
MDEENRSLVAVTGTSGLVGAAIAAALHDAGRVVRGADRVPGRWTTVVGDLRDPAVRRELLRGAGVVVHSAALHAPHVGRVPDEEFRAVNVDVTGALLREAPAARFVYISSTSVYGHALVPVDRAVWVDETVEPRPRDIYDETKLAAEELVAGRGVTLRIARCFPEPLPVLAAHLLHRAVALSDVAAAAVLAVSRGAGTFNIAGPYPFTRDDCVAVHRDAPALLARRAPELVAAFRDRGLPLPRALDRVYDSSAAGEALGYRPLHGIRQLLGSP